MTDRDPLKTLWTNQTEEPVTMSEAGIRARAEKFDSTIGWRNAREYLAGAFVVVFFGYYAVTRENPVQQLGAAAVVLAALFVTWRLAAMGGASSAGDPAASWFARHRAHLVRQREMLRTVWKWYALPFVPGLTLMIAGRHAYPEFRLHELDAWVALALPTAFLAAVFGGIVWLNHVAAKKLQAEIDELDHGNRD